MARFTGVFVARAGGMRFAASKSVNERIPRPHPVHRERVLESGAQTLGTADLLALLISTGAEGVSASAIAASVLEAAGSLSGLFRLGPHGLAARRGVGPAKAARVVAALELGRRAMIELMGEERAVIGAFEAVVRWAEPRLSLLEHEEVWVLVLDGRNGLKSTHRIAQGGLHGCALTAADVLRPALRDAGSAIVLVHNHPSGDPTPSPEDVQMTRAVARACEVVGLRLLDHVVIARGGASSLLELGAFEA